MPTVESVPKFTAWLQRTLWSAIAAALGGLSAPTLFDYAVWKGAATAALITIIGSLSIYARAQANSLPEVVNPTPLNPGP